MQHVGAVGLFPGRDQLLGALISHGVKVVTLLSFQYDGHDLLVSGNDLAFRRLHTSGQFSLFTECLFAFTSLNTAAFPITNNLVVSYCITPPGRHVLIDFVHYQINSRAPEGCSFLWFGRK